jgi:predicted AAA+ superfamily ATPase
MIPRLLSLPAKRSLFLFGARNTGKSTLIDATFRQENSIFFDLLDYEQEMRFARNPAELYNIVKALPDHITHVVIDEIQKLPRLLDEVQRLMKDNAKYFVMTGSSAKKLKHGAANLLAGRAFVYHLFPFSFLELESRFSLEQALHWGTLPQIYHCDTDQERQQFLMSYAHTYLKEEIWAEHFIRELEPFRRFLEVAAQCNGKILNYANIARDVGSNEKTIKTYFQILEDTLLGFFLEPFHHSIRKRQSEKPKFYFFDTGVTRALSHTLSVPLLPGNHAYGNTFEHFVLTECIRLKHYFQPEYQFSYIRTPSDVEVDLVIERPGKPLLLIEIKSSTQVDQFMLSSFIRFSKDVPNSQAICLSNDPYPKLIENITVMPWQQGLKDIFLGE